MIYDLRMKIDLMVLSKIHIFLMNVFSIALCVLLRGPLCNNNQRFSPGNYRGSQTTREK